ncbi:MAG TPA: hypothetical protein VEU08_01685 [Vicinamibacterales bacterium]|nr:hypothetical protein [Vicinamibacterales bacterium]
MKKNWPAIITTAIAGMIIVTFLGGWIVELLWNWLAPGLFGLKTITFWQAWGLLALCRILFGGMSLKGGGSGDRSAMRHRIVDKMADRIAERFESMTPEERERFRQRIRDRMGWDTSPRENPGH